MTRLLVLSGLLVALLAAAMGFHMRLDARDAAQRLAVAFEARGLRAEVGAAGLRLVPVPHIEMKAITLNGADGQIVLGAPFARAGIQILPLLAGRLALSDIRIDSAALSAAMPTAGEAGQGDFVDSLAVLADSSVRLSLTDARVTLVQPGRLPVEFTALNATMRQADGQGRRHVAARFRYRERDVVLDSTIPATSTSGRPAAAGLRMDVRAPGVQIRASLPGEGQTAGDLSLSVAQVGQTLAWLGQTSPLGQAFEKVELQGRLSRQGSNLAIDGARLSLDGQTLEGALAWNQTGSQPVLAGTLAGSEFDLGRLVTRLAGSRLDRPDMTEWGFDPAEVGFSSGGAGSPRGHDLDLRLSLEKARIGTLGVEDAAAQLLFSPARIDLNLVQAKLHKGSVKARYTVTRATIGGEQRLQIGFDRVDLALLSLDLLGSRKLSGTGTGQLVLEGGGTTLRGLVRNAQGRTNLMIRQGELQGFALAETLRRLERQPLLALRDWRTGRSGFDQAQFAGTVAHGVLDLTEGAVTSPGFVLSLGGQISLAEQTLALKGLLAHPAGRSLQVPFAIAGPWEQPAITPRIEPTSFQRTSIGAPAR